MMKIDRFDGDYAFLSNFYISPIYDTDGIKYPTVEHYFQAMKTLDIKQRQMIAAAPTPGKAKYFGRRVTLRPDWEEVKIDIMRVALRQKFSNPELYNQLQNTGNAYLEEGNWWHDTFWGVCNGQGENHLGQLLMEIRGGQI